ncbi:tRNA (adenosine(37)-N6)-threonylcarbamoyltransferase complex ATPase subunit type 1 TsaE [Candidatus Gracilibacteria bacterium]|nr:tRNA (adenosine(37)-N6)-threonylcarbamoyltransferase complex ATPase subunit type 1 TsaE [Candidatus Gracilibacteria bacterium]
MNITIETLPDFLFDLKPGDRIFLIGNLGAGKTTFAQGLIRKFLNNPDMSPTSPTYTYYNNYENNLYHFDLYRVEHGDDVVRIGAEEIFDNPESICIIEWPEILGDIVAPTKIVQLTETEEGREISITNCQAGHIDKPI